MKEPKFPLDHDYFWDIFRRLIAVDSTTGQYEAIQALCCTILGELGYPYYVTHKGGVVAELSAGENAADAGMGDVPDKVTSPGGISASPGALCITAHLDVIGLMVRSVNRDGTLQVCPVGGLYPFYCVTENVRIYTRDGKVFTGTVCRTPNSIHVTEDEIRSVLPDFRTNVCVVVDADVKSAEDVRKLGIETGDIIALEPRLTFSNGYIKSRFIDDKAAVALLLAAMKSLKEQGITLKRKVYAFFTVYEEICHGASWIPADVADILAVDIAPLGPDQNSDEHKVSIFAKDSRYPYHWVMTNELRETAIENHIDCCMDIFTPHYGTDGDVSLAAGHDIRHAAIGFGTANSHGYERTHMDGLENTYALLMAYLMRHS